MRAKREAPEHRVKGGCPEGVTSVMTRVVSRMLLLPTLMVAAGVLVKGYAQPGDGFSAGVIASLGVVLQYLAFGREQVRELLPLRGLGKLAFIGLGITLVVAIRPLFFGEPVLTHWPPPGQEPIYLGTLELITAVAFDVGIFLLVFGYATGVIDLIARLLQFVERHGPDEERGRGTEDLEALGEEPG